MVGNYMPSSSRVVGGCTLSYFDSNESADLKFQFCNFERNFTLSNLKIKYGRLSFGHVKKFAYFGIKICLDSILNQP